MPGTTITGSSGLLTVEIKPRRETYYLVTSDNLADIRSKSGFSDLFTLIASIGWGGYISTILTIRASAVLAEDTRRVLETYQQVFFVGSVVFTGLALLYLVWTYHRIGSVKKSVLEAGQPRRAIFPRLRSGQARRGYFARLHKPTTKQHSSWLPHYL